MNASPFYSGLAALLRAGMPVREAVDAMRADGTLPDPVVATTLAGGGTLADALRRAPHLFPAEEIALVEAGEETGRLDAVLDRLAEIRDQQRRAWQTFWSQCRYPLFVLHFALLLMPLGVLTLTTGRLQISKSVSISLVLMGVLWAGILALRFAARDARTRARIFEMLARVPGLGSWLRHQRAAHFASVLEASYESGMTLDRALRLAAGTTGAKSALRVADRVEQGTPLGEALQHEGPLAAALVGRLATAERAGNLGTELGRIAREEFEAADRSLAVLVGFLSKGFYVLVLLAGAFYVIYVMSTVYGAYERL